MSLMRHWRGMANRLILNYFSICRLLASKRPPFALQLTAFYIAICRLLQTRTSYNAHQAPSLREGWGGCLEALGWVLGGCVVGVQPVIFPKTLCKTHASTSDTASISSTVRQ